MTKRTIKETIREYDAHGKLVRETITETQEEEDVSAPPKTINWWSTEPYCGYRNGDLTPNYCTCGTTEDTRVTATEWSQPHVKSVYTSETCDAADVALSTALEGDPSLIGTVYASGACNAADAAIAAESHA